ncbi:MAG: [NiFe]-hydrogenase assembly chaperone HybE [Burkholderiales bacterium]|jgi:[NiFe] hydrogenase assembly HybE family chaperone|nr:[NiFe]-hydrogenase assembly chaperone HybE [Burkholderiales bacterium]
MDDGRPAPVADAPVIERAGHSPAEVALRVERAFDHIHATRMQDMPFVNAALRVEAVGFRRWEGRWLGVLITPWFMNLMLLPDEPAAWRHVRYGDSLGYLLPAGVFEFISAVDPQLGGYQSCSLFSPMFEFGDQAGARETALAALTALFDADTRAGVEGPGTPMNVQLVDPDAGPPAAAGAAQPAAQPAAPVSKRDFLRGRWSSRADDAAAS